ncbi:maltase A3-like [Culicoides brevitarsis]|uniref:maltase A3-like n=1 Tax=Culicoides brevitarsis TaxID=469753 RepID=UPI00307C7B0B
MLQTAILVILLSISIQFVNSEEEEWWRGANFYQIYPKSFKDSDGDGYGDLQGIRSKIPYLKEIGITGVWLSPIYTSPQKDGGYDITDYKAIDPIFGTMQDFDELLATVKEHGMHLILDFVPNHTSDEAEWFKKSVARDPQYENYYVWHPGKPDPDGGQNLPPSNWLSVFRFSAWKWNEERGEYYLHQFVEGQPDLNYRDPNLVADMKDVLRFWLRRGVSGFRIDTIPNLFETVNEDGSFPDEPASGYCDDPESHCYLNHIYTANLPETMDMAYQWHAVLEEFRHDEVKILMTEAYSSLDIIVEYYGNSTHNGSQVPFNFEVLTKLKKDSSARDLKKIAENYLNYIPSGRGYLPNWVLGNHDQHRFPSRLGETRADLYNIFLQTMPGNAITYQGEELAMPNVVVSWEDTQDPQACNTNRTVYHSYSRDPARTPFPWDGTTNAGFSTGTPWIPAGTEYPLYNVEKQMKDTNSHLKIFKKLTTLHKSPAFKNGIYVPTNYINDNVFSYLRSDNNETYVIALNFGKQMEHVNFNDAFVNLGKTGVVEVASLGSSLQEGSECTLNSVSIPADTGVVIKVKNGVAALFNRLHNWLLILVVTIFVLFKSY